MIYDSALIENLHGYCYSFSAEVLGLSEGTFNETLGINRMQIVPVSDIDATIYVMPQFQATKVTACSPKIGKFGANFDLLNTPLNQRNFYGNSSIIDGIDDPANIKEWLKCQH